MVLAGLALVVACGKVQPLAIDAAGDPGDAASERPLTDLPDDVTGHQIHVLYVLPSDGVDRQLDRDGTIATSVAAWTSWIARKAGGPQLRLDTFHGKPDITFVRLGRTGAALAATGVRIRDELEKDLTAAGLIDSTKIYATYYDGDATTCGGSPVPPGLVGRVTALYLDGHVPSAIPCRDNPLAASADTPGFFELSLIRGVLHTLGAVPGCAPHVNGVGGVDVNDSPADIMYTGTMPWAPSAIDVGHDDYWGHTNTSCLDLAHSAFLDPLPAGPQLPPGW